MNPIVQSWSQVVIIGFGYLIGIYFQNKRLDDFKDAMNKRFDDLKDYIKSEVKRLEERSNKVIQ